MTGIWISKNIKYGFRKEKSNSTHCLNDTKGFDILSEFKELIPFPKGFCLKRQIIIKLYCLGSEWNFCCLLMLLSATYNSGNMLGFRFKKLYSIEEYVRDGNRMISKKRVKFETLRVLACHTDITNIIIKVHMTRNCSLQNHRVLLLGIIMV